MKTLLLITALFVAQGNSREPLPPPSEGCNGVGNPHCADDVPIDGGLGILAVAGGAYAIKKLKEKNK